MNWRQSRLVVAIGLMAATGCRTAQRTQPSESVDRPVAQAVAADEVSYAAATEHEGAVGESAMAASECPAIGIDGVWYSRTGKLGWRLFISKDAGERYSVEIDPLIGDRARHTAIRDEHGLILDQPLRFVRDGNVEMMDASLHGFISRTSLALVDRIQLVRVDGQDCLIHVDGSENPAAPNGQTVAVPMMTYGRSIPGALHSFLRE